MKPDISLLNQFLFVLSELRPFTPADYLANVMARMQVYGYTFEVPSPNELNTDYGDIFILMDQWGDVNDPNVNQLEKKFGEKYYLNLVWYGRGSEIISHVVAESEVDEDSFMDPRGDSGNVRIFDIKI